MSMFYELMMKKKGGGVKILNLESVNGATLDKNFVFYNDSNQSYMYNKYFKTKEPIDLRNIGNDILFKIKFKITGNQSGIFCADNSQTGWYTFLSSYVNSSTALWVSIDANYRNPPTLQLNTWYYLKISHSKSSSYYKVEYSLDDINYTLIDNYVAYNQMSAMYMFFGSGASTSSNYGLIGYIDFKETDIIINGKSVLWVDNPSILLTVVGSLTITDDVVSGFSNSNYLTLATPFAPSDKDFEIVIKFKCYNFSENVQQIFYFGTDSVYNSYSGIDITSAGRVRLISKNIFSSDPFVSIQANTDVWVRLKREGNSVNFATSSDGVNYGAGVSTTVSGSLSWSGTQMFGLRINQRAFDGEIDFNNSYIVLDGTKYIFTIGA